MTNQNNVLAQDTLADGTDIRSDNNASNAPTQSAPAANDGRTLLAFRDKSTDTYYAGEIDTQKRTHDLSPIGSRTKIKEWLRQHEQEPLEIIPTYDFRFEPANDVFFDPERRFINRYVPPAYQLNAVAQEGAEIPPGIKRLIEHVLGNDGTTVEHFLNWLAVVFRYRARTETAWILQGTTGTGKGLLYREILRPLMGLRYSKEVNLTNLEDRFNAYANGTIVLFIDEADTDQVKSMPTLMSRIKTLITEDTIALRAMRKDLREVPNNMNLIIASNHLNAMRIEANDRRLNVAPRQEAKLLAPGEDGAALVEQIRQELQEFANYLMSRTADQAVARRALENPAKHQLQVVTQTPIEVAASALAAGDLSYFLDMQPNHSAQERVAHSRFDGVMVSPVDRYREFLDDAQQARGNDRKHVIPHRHLFAIFQLLVGGMPATKTKLTQMLGRCGIVIEPHTVDGTSVRGFGVRWQISPERLEPEVPLDQPDREDTSNGAAR